MAYNKYKIYYNVSSLIWAIAPKYNFFFQVNQELA